MVSWKGQKGGNLEFHKLVWGEELERWSIEQLESADTLLFGRTTCEGMAAYWTQAKGRDADLMNSIKKVVFSTTLKQAEWNNTELIKEHPADAVAKLKRQPGKDVYIFGSAKLSSTLMQHGLIDEYRLALVPVILGRGNPLFKEGLRVPMKLLEAKQLKNGCVIVRYEPQNGNTERSAQSK